MTTTLATPILIKTIDALCDGGQCGGSIALTTDVNHSAYAVVTETENGYIEADTDLVLRDREADTITVTCPSIQMNSDQECSGSATFNREALNAAKWFPASSTVIAYMHTMDVA